MIHILAPRPCNASLPVIINIGGTVGKNASNQGEDVLFVKFCMKTMGSGPVNPVYCPPALRNLMSNIMVNASMDALTEDVIRRYYIELNGDPSFMVQPVVSPAPNSSAYSDSKRLIYRLNQHMRMCLGDKWPNIGQLPGCPAGLISAIKRALVGT